MAAIVDYNGLLALDLGWTTNWAEPQRERDLWVSDIKSSEWPGVVNQTVRIPCRSVYDRNSQTWVSVNTEGWKYQQDVEPVKKPPRRGNYDYEWSGGRWVRIWCPKVRGY